MTGHSQSKPWRVYRQYNDKPDTEVCAHRWGWVAELCASRRETSKRHRSEWGVFYTARRAGTDG